MKENKTTSLGLAAYIKVNGGELSRIDGNCFVFFSDKSERDWGIAYSNSNESRFNSTLIELNKLRRGAE